MNQYHSASPMNQSNTTPPEPGNKKKGKLRLIAGIFGALLLLSIFTSSFDKVPKSDYDDLQAKYEALQGDYDKTKADLIETTSELETTNKALKTTVAEYDSYKERMKAFDSLPDEDIALLSEDIQQVVTNQKAAKEAAKKAAEEKQAAEEAAKQKAAEDAAKQKAAEEAASIQAASQDQQGEMVWIPRTGHKYHSSSTCSNMKNPREVTISEAQRLGYEPCKKCY